ncbi:MAG: hypothetical protein QOH04_1516 [Sphingomonadales bacterium]|nr:hypothetical protein [Sphingomonadales bacterium]
MKFFIPYVESREADRLWHEVRRALGEIGLATTERRVQALALASGRGEHILAVGMAPPDSEEPILMILEADGIDLFYACTDSRGVEQGIPYPLGLTGHGYAINFDREPARLH